MIYQIYQYSQTPSYISRTDSPHCWLLVLKPSTFYEGGPLHLRGLARPEQHLEIWLLKLLVLVALGAGG